MCSLDQDFEEISKDYFKQCEPTLNDSLFLDTFDPEGDILMKQEPLCENDDFSNPVLSDLHENLFSMDEFKDFTLNVLEEATNNIDSNDTRNNKFQFPFVDSDFVVGSMDSTDAVSEVSSTSDLGSMISGDSSPDRRNQQELIDFSPQHSIMKHSPQITVPPKESIITAGPNKTKIKLETVHAKTPTLKTTVRNTAPTNPQTIVFTQSGKQPQVLRNGTLIKTVNKGSSVFFPLQVVKDIGQGRTFKLISSPNNNNNNNNQVRNGIRTLTVRTTPQTNGLSRSVINKANDGRPILKVGPTVSNGSTHRVVPPVVTVKDEPILCDTEDDEDRPRNGQKLELTDEEKRLLDKDNIVLPACYPLSKAQERDLKKIRRKIRNKISAQDSRKRKKDYVDQLEERAKSCAEHNQKLQKRIRHLETENETLAAHLRRYQELVEAGGPAKPHGQASTALMILILSAALVIVPNLRPKDITEGDLSTAMDEPLPGKNRNLLGTAVALVKKELNMDKLKHLNLDDKDFNPLTEHDYAPLAKRPRLSSSSPTPFHDFLPKLERSLSAKAGEPPDYGSASVSAFLGAILDSLNRNWNESRQEMKPLATANANWNDASSLAATQSLVVNLPNGKIVDDIEVE